MKIGFIGAGNMTAGLGKMWRAHGHELFISHSRDRVKLKALADQLGAKYGSAQEAVRFADVVVLAVGWSGAMDALKAAGDFGGKILWSIVNPLTPDFRGLEIGTTTSATEEIAKAATGARIVGGSPPFASLLQAGDTRFGGERGSVFYYSDDNDAKRPVGQLIEQLDCDGVDVGPLYTARFVEPTMLLMVHLAYPRKMGPIALQLRRR